MTLSHDTVQAPGAAPAQWLYMLHGIFGSGRNWASIARRLVRARPEWGVQLIDLRQHGDSQGFPGPHTVAAAAADLESLAAELGVRPAGVHGHSFGGKVALAYARDHGAELRHVWVIDSTPEARVPDGSAWEMLEVIRSTPREFASRDELIQLLVRPGIAHSTAQWMATNLEHVDGAYRWRFDFDAIEELLRDFFRLDLWGVVEHPPGDAVLHVVKGSESNVLSPPAVERIQAIAQREPRVHFHELAGGHWLNADNPDGLHELLAGEL